MLLIQRGVSEVVCLMAWMAWPGASHGITGYLKPIVIRMQSEVRVLRSLEMDLLGCLETKSSSHAEQGGEVNLQETELLNAFKFLF